MQRGQKHRGVKAGDSKHEGSIYAMMRVRPTLRDGTGEWSQVVKKAKRTVLSFILPLRKHVLWSKRSQKGSRETERTGSWRRRLNEVGGDGVNV